MAHDGLVFLTLEVLGAGLYFLNKVFLNFMERCELNHYASAYWHWRRRAWDVYLIGSIFVIVFLINLPRPALILASIEAGGIPSMVAGSILARRRGKASPWLNLFAVLGTGWGIWWSLRAFNGLTSATQMCELAGSLGFLIGLYLLAVKDKAEGYFGFIVMNLATGLLFIYEERWMFAVQQLASVIFVLEAYWIAGGREPFLPLPLIFRKRIFAPRIQ